MTTLKARKRPEVLSGQTFKIRTNAGKLFLIVNFDGDTPFEIFVKVGKVGDDVHCLCEAIGRLVSLGLRYGIPTEAIVQQMRGIGGEGLLMPTVPDMIAKALSESQS